MVKTWIECDRVVSPTLRAMLDYDWMEVNKYKPRLKTELVKYGLTRRYVQLRIEWSTELQREQAEAVY